MSSTIRNHERKEKKEFLKGLTDDELINELKKRKLGDRPSEDYEMTFMPKGLLNNWINKKAGEIAKETLKEARADKELSEKIDKATEMSENKGIITKCSLCKKPFYEQDTATAIKVKSHDKTRLEAIYHRDCFLKRGTTTEKEETNTFNGKIKENE